MKRAYLLFVPVIIISYVCFAYADMNTIPVVTTKGETLHLTEFTYGFFKFFSKGERITIGKDSQGNPIYRYKRGKSDFHQTTNIPLKIGDSFGFRFKIPQIATDDELIIKTVITLPQSVLKNGETSDIIEGNLVYKKDQSNQINDFIWTFDKENPEYHLPGVWKISLYNNGKLIASNRFMVKN